MRVIMNGTRGIHTIQSYTVFRTSIGWCGIVMAQRKVHRLFIGYARLHQLKRHIRDAFGDDIGLNCSGTISMVIKKLQRFCCGEKVSLSDVPMDWSSLTEFQQRVLRAAAQIPYGSVDTYGGLARKIGSARSARAVGNALARNPFPLLIPCHRVVKGDGRIGGFSAGDGIRLKNKLLSIEMGDVL